MNGRWTPSSGASTRITVDCETCPARSDGLCRDCSPDVLRTIARYKADDREIKAGQELFSLGQPCEAIYNLVEGWVFLYNLLPDGRRQILHFALPGAVLGFHPGQKKGTYGAQALTDAVVCVLPHANLVPLSREQPDIGMRLAWLVARDRSLSYDHLTSIGRHSARERVAHLLLELSVRCRNQWPGQRGEQMALPLTQEHIADATGLSAVHVSRVLSGLYQDGILSYHYRQLRILDPDRLWDVADLDPQVVHSWLGRDR